jgi:dihydrofolate synthase / folylpolyglutamate synthase
MTYSEVIDYLFHQYPQYQKIGASAYKPGLNQISRLCEKIGNPQNSLKFIHVAGTNGKGSTCNMLASILSEGGYKTGLFTSPHLIDFRERIRIDGQVITEKEVIEFVEKFKDEFESVQASFFEWSTALAFYYFHQSNVDVVVLETGLGGRLDSTNIVMPIISVITPIGMDHMQFLGNTLEDIAKEKAGIIKFEVPCVVAFGNKDVEKVFVELAHINNAPLFIVDEIPEENRSSLKGDYQRINIATVYKVVEILNSFGWKLGEQTVKNGLLNVKGNTGFRGRWELLRTLPDCIADIGHNFEGVSQIVHQIKLIRHNYDKIHIVWGMVQDKEIARIVQILPVDVDYYLSSPKIQRALLVKQLAGFFKKTHRFTMHFSCSEAFENALNKSGKNDLVLIGGSNFVVAEIIENFFNNNLQA